MMPAQKSFDLVTFMAVRWRGSARSGSVLPDIAFGNHTFPLLELRLDECRAVLRAGAARRDAHLGESGLHLVLPQHLGDVAVEPRQHVTRNTGRREHAQP